MEQRSNTARLLPTCMFLYAFLRCTSHGIYLFMELPSLAAARWNLKSTRANSICQGVESRALSWRESELDVILAYDSTPKIIFDGETHSHVSLPKNGTLHQPSRRPIHCCTLQMPLASVLGIHFEQAGGM